MHKESLLTLYYSFIYPYFVYGIEVWGNACKTYLSCLVKLQKKIMRIISFTSRYHSSEQLFKQTNVLSLGKIYQFKLLLFMHRFVNGNVPAIFDIMFTRNDQIHTHFTRSHSKLHLPRSRTQLMVKSFRNTAIKLYNSCVSKFKFSLRLSLFKPAVRQYLLQHDILI